MKKKPRILIGTLYSRENEYDESKRSLIDQTYSDWRRVVFAHLPNKLAHDYLYKTFMEKGSEFDLFVKLDADTVFRNKSSLNEIVDFFLMREGLDHAVFGLWDWFSDSMIMGLHAFSNRVKWKIGKENLFVDLFPEIPGYRIETKDFPSPVGIHSPNPSAFQAFHFGVHRALKVLQLEQQTFDLGQSNFQWSILKKTFRNFAEKMDKRLGFACLGAELVMRDNIMGYCQDYTSNYLEEKFEAYKEYDARHLLKLLESGRSFPTQMEREFRRWNKILKCHFTPVAKKLFGKIGRACLHKYFSQNLSKKP